MSRIRVNHKVNLGWCFKSLCLAGSLYLVTRGFIELCEWSERWNEAKFKKEQREKFEETAKKAAEAAEIMKKLFSDELEEALDKEKEPVEEVTEANFDGEKEYFDEEKMEFVYKDA